MKLLVLMDTAEVSGPAKQFLALVPRLAERGVGVHCAVFQPADREPTAFARAVAGAGIDHSILPYAGRLDRQLPGRLRTLVGRVRPDVVQTHSYRPTALTALLRRHRSGWRWVAFYHGATRENLRVRLYHVLDNVLMRLADRVVVVSEMQRGRYRGPAPRVEVLHNAILEGRRADPPPGLPEPSPGVAKLAVVGRLSREKGVDIFLRMAGRLEEVEGMPFVAVVAGDGVDRHRLEGLHRRLGLDDSVRFLGHVSPVEGVYAWSDIVVIPSRSEGMPNVLLEAVRQGRRVVTTDVGNVRRIVGGCSLAEVVEPNDPAALASATVRMIGRLSEPYPDRERDSILDRFSLDRRVEAHLRLYEEVLRGDG